MPSQRGDDRRRVFAGDFYQRGETRMAFHQGRDVTVPCSAQEIALPMTRNGAVLHFSGPFPDGDGLWDLTARVFEDTRVLRPAYATLGPQVLQQLLFQHSARLNEQASVNGFVGHTHVFIIGILDFQPSGNLFRRPVQNQFTRNDVPQLHVDGKKAPLGPKGRLPSLVVGLTSSIRRTATMTCDLPAHGRRNSVQAFSYLPNRRSGSEPSRDFLALTQREREERPPPHRRNNPSVKRHQTANGSMWLAESPPNLMQRLPRLPTGPHLKLLRRRKPKPFPWLHKHHL